MNQPLAHLPGDQRREIQEFARAYYAGLNPSHRDKIAARYERLRGRSTDVSAAMDQIVLFVCLRQLEKLLAFTGLSEAELKKPQAVGG